MLKRLLAWPTRRSLGTPAVIGAAAWLAGAYLAFAIATTRWTMQGGGHLERFATEGLAGAPGQGALIAFWHERLATSGALLARIRSVARRRAVSVVVSRNRDGRLIAAALRRFEVDVLFGSTARPERGRGQDKGGAVALRSMLQRLAVGELVAITPDGPRGPAHRAAPGLAQVAALSGCPVLPFAGALRWRVRLRSWDRLTVPLPFGRGVLVCLPPIAVPRDGWREALPRLEAALNAAAQEADRLCAG